MRAETSEVISLAGGVAVARKAPVLSVVPAPLPTSPPCPKSRFDLTACPVVTRAEQIAATLAGACEDGRRDGRRAVCGNAAWRTRA